MVFPFSSSRIVLEFGRELAGLSRAALRGHEPRDLGRKVFDGGGPAPHVPQERRAPGQVAAGRARARRVPARDDRRGGVAERAGHDVHLALARREVFQPRLPDLDQLPGERVVAADEDRARLVARFLHLVVALGDRQADAGRFEAQPGGDVGGADRIRCVAHDQAGIRAIGNQVLVGVSVPAFDGVRVGQVERLGRRQPRFDDAAGVWFGGEFIGIDWGRQRAAVQSRAPDGHVPVRFAVGHDRDPRLGSLREAERPFVLSPSVRVVQAGKGAGRAVGLRRVHGEADADGGDPPAVGVHHERHHRGGGALDAIDGEVTGNLLLDRAQGDPRHVPQPREPRRQFHARRQRSRIVASRDDESRTRAKRRGQKRDEPLARLQALDADRVGLQQRLDEAVAPANQDRKRDRRRFPHLVVFQDERQAQRRRLVTQPGGDVRGGFDVVRAGCGRHDDPCGDQVGEAVAVRVADHGVRTGEDPGKRGESGVRFDGFRRRCLRAQHERRSGCGEDGGQDGAHRLLLLSCGWRRESGRGREFYSVKGRPPRVIGTGSNWRRRVSDSRSSCGIAM